VKKTPAAAFRLCTVYAQDLVTRIHLEWEQVTNSRMLRAVQTLKSRLIKPPSGPTVRSISGTEIGCGQTILNMREHTLSPTIGLDRIKTFLPIIEGGAFSPFSRPRIQNLGHTLDWTSVIPGNSELRFDLCHFFCWECLTGKKGSGEWAARL